jgi:hypothetical protein
VEVVRRMLAQQEQLSACNACNRGLVSVELGDDSGNPLVLPLRDRGEDRRILLFRGRHFHPEIIVLCVKWYLRFELSSRDLVQMMAERGIALTRTTILRWCSAMCQSSRSAGTSTLGKWADHGV